MTPVITGCTNPGYLEYDPQANTGSDSVYCLVQKIEGCTNQNANNYNSSANTDDGSCEGALGCTNPIALNFDSTADTDDKLV